MVFDGKYSLEVFLIPPHTPLYRISFSGTVRRNQLSFRILKCSKLPDNVWPSDRCYALLH